MKRNMLTVLTASIVVSAFLLPTGAGAAEAGKSQVAILAAAPNAKATAAIVSKVNMLVDGVSNSVRALQTGSTTLYSVRDLAAALKAELDSDSGFITLYSPQQGQTIKFKLKQAAYLVDEAQFTFKHAPVDFNGTMYVELDAILTGLGGESISTVGLVQISSMKKLTGEFSAPRWNAQGQLIVTRMSDDGVQTCAYEPATGVYRVLSNKEDAAVLAVSPQGIWGAYNNNDGHLFLMDLISGSSRVWSKDNTVKTDLLWSADGEKLYFMQGDKQEKIANVSLQDGKVNTIVNDKVENKSNVRVSSDGKSILYTVSVTGVAKNDADSTEDSLTIDYSNAGDQLFTLDLSKKDAKPVQLTKSSDNKLYSILLNDGRVAYVSASIEGNSNSTLKVINPADLKSTVLVGDLDVTFAAPSASGKLIVAGTAADGSTKVYEVALDGQKSLLYSTTGTITELTPAANGAGIAAIEDDKLIYIANGSAKALSK